MYPPLLPIPVAGPFDRVGVDVLQLPNSAHGNRYAIVFVNYLTKWPEVYPAKDQTAITIAKLILFTSLFLQRQLLSDQGAALISKLILELMGTRKVNATAYHPQMVLWNVNHTLIDVLLSQPASIDVIGTADCTLCFLHIERVQESTLLYRSCFVPFFLEIHNCQQKL